MADAPGRTAGATARPHGRADPALAGAPARDDGGMSQDEPAALRLRIEHDSMGEVEVPADALWGAQTQRAIRNFRVSGEPLPAGVIRALALIKGAAAAANAELGVLDPEMAAAIGEAAAEVAGGAHLDQFPLDVFQTGSGTSSNMNANEVIARMASQRLGRPVHPNDHVNASQSSNDVFPSAVHIAAALELRRTLLPALSHLALALEHKAAEFAGHVKAGRTHLMDATPVTLGQEFGGYAAAVRHGAQRVGAVLPDVSELPLGGTATGTGLNAPPGFAATVIARLARDLDLPLTEARDHFEAAGGRDALVAASGALRVTAASLFKVCNDLRWMNSGPRAGLAEIALPDLQPGSSIMPGKVNPVIPEVVCQVTAQVIGNDAAIAFAAAAARQLADDCVSGITADAARLRRLAESSPAIVTALNRYLGYEAAAGVAHEALATGRTIRDVVIGQGWVERGALTEAQLDAALDVLAMSRPQEGRPRG